jgi:hypothetical protein
MPSQRTSARWGRGVLRDSGGRLQMQNLATHALGSVDRAAVQCSSAYDVG